MSDRSGIEWCTSTVSAVRGCWPVSPGCLHCYAGGLAARFSGPGGTYEGLAEFRGRPGARRANWTGKITLHPEQLELPLRWRKPRVIFWNHTSDTWHEDVPNEYIAAMFGVAAATPQHTHIFLTKRPERMRSWSAWLDAAGISGEATCAEAMERQGIAHPWLDEPLGGVTFPLPNVVGMVTVENRKHGVPRIEQLRQVPFAMRGLSIEPLIEDLGLLDLRHIDWVIVGGESGSQARPMHPSWARSIRDQCVTAGIPFFFKQWGEWIPRSHCVGEEQWAFRRRGTLTHGGQWSESVTPLSGDDDLRFVGKVNAGRELDGKMWDERPRRFAA